MAKRGEVFLVTLDPTVGAEMQKTRPAVVVSPDELNGALATVIVVPLTTGRAYPFRPQTRVGGKPGIAAVDQVRTIDKRRLSRRIGVLSEGALTSVLGSLAELFAV
ncbi:MAG: type II toxin-antitoxin system PemK/MazF family toxin [Myxococcales bacterium]|nr:type II toxin-antitoxin system PemK/MazF family toxin [Myxococcales bacterium]